MNVPAKCLCKELSTQQTASGFRWVPTETPGGFRLESDASGNYVNVSYVPRIDPVAQQAKDMVEQMKKIIPVSYDPVAATLVVEPVIKDRAKWQMNYFWKEACKAEGVSFTRKEHCAYPSVLATYRRLRKEYEEQSEKMMRERSSGW